MLVNRALPPPPIPPSATPPITPRPRNRLPIHRQRRLPPHLCNVLCTGPLPIHRPPHQPAFHRVPVKIRNLLPDKLRRPQIRVIAPAPLPESITSLSIGLHIQHLRQKRRSMLPHESQRLVGHRLLNRLQKHRYVVNAPPRPHQQMHMLGHDHPRPQRNLMLLQRISRGLNQPQTLRDPSKGIRFAENTRR